MGCGEVGATAMWCSSSFPSSSSSSMKLLMFLVPLILVSWLVALVGPNSSKWVVVHSVAPNPSSSSSLPFDSDHTGVPDLTSKLVIDLDQHNMEEAHSDDSVSNISSSPPLLIEQKFQEPVMNETMADMDFFDESISGFNNYTSNHREHVQLTKGVQRRENKRLEEIEASLSRVRTAIREAQFSNQTQDPDYVPVGPMYWNANAFHRSYLEMEKQFKIFVYEEGEPPVFHNGPCKSIYSTEGNFIHAIEMNGHFRTRDPDKAHVFFLPFSVAMLVQFVYIRDSHDFTPIKQTVIDYVNVVGERYPFWNRSLGADHFMLSCHDWGPEASRSVPDLHKNSIRVLCNANTSEGFNPSKDVSFPEINLQTGHMEGFLGGPSPSRRPILAFFAGGLHGPIRPIVIEHWENKDEDIKVHKYLPKGVSYYDMLRKSKYCLCPSGYEVASPRIVEAIYTGCVPVLISDHYIPPFSDVLNWKSISVEVSVKDIPNLKNILTSISPRQYIRMHRRVINIRKHFEVNFPPKRFDLFHMILHSVWLRRLNIRIEDNIQ